jgi:hypothetical protein
MQGDGTTSSAALRDDPRRIEVVYAGDVTAEVLAGTAGEALTLARENDEWHVLTDCRGMSSDPSIFSLYDLAALLSQLGVAGRYREALVTPESSALDEGFEFYENTMVNRGLQVRCFRSRDDAIGWLRTD